MAMESDVIISDYEGKLTRFRAVSPRGERALRECPHVTLVDWVCLLPEDAAMDTLELLDVMDPPVRVVPQ